MARHKGLLTVIAAIDLLPAALRRRVELTVVSDLRDGAVDLRAPYIKHVPSATNAEVMALLRNSDALCLPSRRESFGLAFIEAMAAGCAILGPNRSIQRAMLGDVAVLVEPENVAAVQEGLQQIAEVRFRREAVERGYALYRLKYAPDRVADAFVSAAERVLAARPPMAYGSTA
jgi:glycosyltransferase involved in cell wall biosynthesis